MTRVSKTQFMKATKYANSHNSETKQSFTTVCLQHPMALSKLEPNFKHVSNCICIIIFDRLCPLRDNEVPIQKRNEGRYSENRSPVTPFTRQELIALARTFFNTVIGSRTETLPCFWSNDGYGYFL